MSLWNRGILDGYLTDAGRVFRPSQSMTRAQFAKMLVGTFGADVPAAGQTPFRDLGPDDANDPYPHQFIAVAAMHGIAQGTEPGVFEPWGEVLRTQAVTMTMRAADSFAAGRAAQPLAGYAGSLGDFSQDHAAHMVRAEYNGLLEGIGGYGSSWHPWIPITRGEAAKLLGNILPLTG